MKIVQINTFSNKSTGTIMMNLHNLLRQESHESYVVWGRGRAAKDDYEIKLDDDFGVKLHGVYTRVTDKTGFASQRITKQLVRKLEVIKPDIIHLHNLHGYYINIEILFSYIRKNNIKVVWTLHDCWSFTGHCAHFTMSECNKWKEGCNNCVEKNAYPASVLMDNSKWNWLKKRELFTKWNISIVTPCQWLKDLVHESFLKEYPTYVIYNGIDLDVFKPQENPENREKICKKYCLDSKPIILGVASDWTERKGLNDFVRLSEMLREELQFVMVGLNEKQLKQMPSSINGIKRTNDAYELADLYAVADVFFNPTYEDNFPTTNLEALACGTPVLTYDTGGSPEAIEMGKVLVGEVGKIIKKINSREVDLNEVKCALVNMVRDISVAQKAKRSNMCRMVAKEYDKNCRLREYIDLYQQIMK